jgi:hypothetical protein
MKTLRFFPIVVALAALQCVNPNGGGSTTETALIRGTLYLSDGIIPAAGVRVNIRPKESLADTTGAGIAKTLASLTTVDSVTTDSAGRFAFDTTLDTGTYVITSASGNNAVLIDSVKVTNRDSTDTLPSDTLKPAGALKGIIKLSEGGDTRKVFVLAFGIDRFARVNADGSFKFSNLAEATYDLRLISSLDNYGVLDTDAISVKSADTTDLDTVELPFTGIPTPRGVAISYDTLKQIVTLTWSKADTSLVKSYNVYRRNVDSNTVPVRINGSPVVDTVYRDSTGVQGTTYEYMVAAVNKSAAEGTKSAAVSVKVAGAFLAVDTLILTNAPMGNFAVDSKGFFYLTNLTSNSIEVFDPNGNKVREWVVSRKIGFDYIRANNLFLDKNDKIFVYTYYDSIMVYDTLGTKLKSFGASIGSCEGIVFIGDTCYVAVEQPNREIMVFDSVGKQIDTIRNNWGISDNFYSMIGDSLNNLCLFGGFGSTNDRNKIELISKNGTLTGYIMQTAELPDGIITLAKGSFLLASSNAVSSFDFKNNLLFKFSTPSTPTKAVLNGNGDLLVGFKQGLIVKYKR